VGSIDDEQPLGEHLYVEPADATEKPWGCSAVFMSLLIVVAMLLGSIRHRH
jgi:hypothetical protein